MPRPAEMGGMGRPRLLRKCVSFNSKTRPDYPSFVRSFRSNDEEARLQEDGVDVAPAAGGGHWRPGGEHPHPEQGEGFSEAEAWDTMVQETSDVSAFSFAGLHLDDTRP